LALDLARRDWKYLDFILPMDMQNFWAKIKTQDVGKEYAI